MASFAYDDAPIDVPDDISRSHREAWQQLAGPGTWWTAAERLGIAARARERFAARSTPPWLREDSSALATLDRTTVAVVDKVTLDAQSIHRDWAVWASGELGAERYVELVAVVATIVMLDVYAEAVGVDPTPLPNPEPGEPSRQRPDGLGDIGAYVPMLEPFPAANVARALSLVPDANRLFRTVSVPTYSAPGFADLVWDTPLSRPQVELIASRVAALNECFY
jgi:hypothetical protein